MSKRFSPRLEPCDKALKSGVSPSHYNGWSSRATELPFTPEELIEARTGYNRARTCSLCKRQGPTEEMFGWFRVRPGTLRPHYLCRHCRADDGSVI